MVDLLVDAMVDWSAVEMVALKVDWSVVQTVDSKAAETDGLKVGSTVAWMGVRSVELKVGPKAA